MSLQSPLLSPLLHDELLSLSSVSARPALPCGALPGISHCACVPLSLYSHSTGVPWQPRARWSDGMVQQPYPAPWPGSSLAADEEKLPLSWPSWVLPLPWALTPLPAPLPPMFAQAAVSRWLSAPLTPWKQGGGSLWVGRASLGHHAGEVGRWFTLVCPIPTSAGAKRCFGRVGGH